MCVGEWLGGLGGVGWGFWELEYVRLEVFVAEVFYFLLSFSTS